MRTMDEDSSGGSGLKRVLGLGLLAGAAGYGYMVWRDKGAERAPYMLDAEDGDRSIRRYPELVIAETTQPGTRAQALDRGYRRLADYITAKNRPGDKIAMVAPVLSEKSRRRRRRRALAHAFRDAVRLDAGPAADPVGRGVAFDPAAPPGRRDPLRRQR